jgi:predicted dehydrogenase
METVNVAQIGVGYWGPNLLRNLIASPRFDVKAVVDLSPERRAFVKGLYPEVPLKEDVREVLDDPAISAVVIATPVMTHFDLAMQFLAAGKHILVEKPMATMVAEVERIRDLACRKGLVAMVGHTFMYNPAVRYLKKLVDSGDLGEIRYIYSQRLNLGRIRSDVDALWNFAPHDVSIIQYLLNDIMPSSMHRQGMDYIQKGIDDVVFLTIVYPNKVVAHVHVSWLDPRTVRSMTIVGSKKMVIYDDIAENKIAIYDKGIERKAVLGENMDFDHPSLFTLNYHFGDVLLPRINFEEPLKVEVAHFADCILNGAECITGPEHALKVVKLLSCEGSCSE